MKTTTFWGVRGIRDCRIVGTLRREVDGPKTPSLESQVCFTESSSILQERTFILVHIPFCVGWRILSLILSNHDNIPKWRLTKSRIGWGSLNINSQGRTNERKSDILGLRRNYNILSLPLFRNSINLLQSVHFIFKYQISMLKKLYDFTFTKTILPLQTTDHAHNSACINGLLTLKGSLWLLMYIMWVITRKITGQTYRMIIYIGHGKENNESTKWAQGKKGT